MVASVTTIDGAFTHATIAPLMDPRMTPAAITTRGTSGIGSNNAESPAMTVQIAKIDPTETSISLATMTKVMPIATNNTVTLDKARSRRFAIEKNAGAAITR